MISLPIQFNYLNLNLVINPSDLQVLLENCKQVELKRLSILNWNNDTILNIIKDFAKEKSIEFLVL